MARELRRFREHAGLSRTELARRVGYSRTYISTSEKPGADLISKAVVTRIDQELGADGALIAVHARAEAERQARRTRAEAASSAFQSRDAPAGTPVLRFGDVMGTEMLDLAAAMQPTGVTVSMIEHAEQVVCHIHEHFARVSPNEMLPVVNDHLRATTRLLKAGQPMAYRRRLCSIAGHLAGQRAWLLFDLRRTDHAESWFRLALEPALEAGDDTLAAWLLGAHSVVAHDRGDARQTLCLLERARHHAGRAIHTPTAGWIDALEARARAILAEPVPARRFIARARQRTSRIAADSYRHGMDVRDGELNVDYYEGGSLLALGDAAPAREMFQAAIAAQGPGHLKGRAVVTLQVAMTYAMENDVDQAVDLAVSAWGIPANQRIGPITERMHQLRGMISLTDGRSAERLDHLQSTYKSLSGNDRADAPR